MAEEPKQETTNNKQWWTADSVEERRARRRTRIKELGLEKYDKIPIRKPGLDRPSLFFNTQAEFLERVYAMREQIKKDKSEEEQYEKNAC